MNTDRILSLLRELAAYPGETEWVEFKRNREDPDDIGEYLSALANAAALHCKSRGYLVWGLSDDAHALVGTSFRPRKKRIGNEELESWLSRHLHPHLHFAIHEFADGENYYVLMEVPAATHTPVRFKDREYVRIGSVKKPLRDYPEKERVLWAILTRMPFESGVAATEVPADEVLDLLDYPSYFRLMGRPLPQNREAVVARLCEDSVVSECAGTRYNLTNLGCILFARDLSRHGRLARKALRIVLYHGTNRVRTVHERLVPGGYAVGFQEAIQSIEDQLPRHEFVEQAFRREGRTYPAIAIRELVANAVIHQDFTVTGSGPMVEIFVDRVEITNPGAPLIEPLRFIDEPPRSRNESVASMMRRMAICEERGSGIDKVIDAVESAGLPAPDFRATDNATTVVMLGPRPFSEMERDDRIRGCYQHACLCHVSGKRMTNATLRRRLGIKDSNYPLASRIIRDTVEAGLIKPHGDGGSRKSASYLPYWA